MQRRLFLSAREVPSCLAGAIRGEPRSLRRILGSRRAGRIGAGLFLLGLVAAVPPVGWIPALVTHLVLTAALRAFRVGPSLGYRERLRLSLWTTAAPLAACLPLRWIWSTSMLPGLAGLVLGHALLLRGLRSGLRSPSERARAEDR